MPEGHTLHRLALDLDDTFSGTTPSVSSPQGRFAESAARLDGAGYVAATAHGKHLFVEFGGEQLMHVHLGLYGKLRITAPMPPWGQVRVRLQTADAVADLRGPQQCVLQTPSEVAAQVARLGPDPLRPDADPDRAWRRIVRTDRSIAALLMDQTVLSGVGNVYRAEVLFRNRLDPHRPGRKLSRSAWTAIWSDLVTVMPAGVAARRIETVRPEHMPEVMGRPSRSDRGGGEVYVYRRHGQPCFVCGSRIRTEVLDGRNLYWCGRCQRRG